MIGEIRNKLESGEDKVRLAVALRKQNNLERGSFLLSQAELQLRGRKKFTKADQMLFTRVGLEQATSEVLADYKASQVPDDLERYDVCCGIGGDSIGLGRQKKVVSVDRDETTCRIATHNLAVNCDMSSEVHHEEFENLNIPENAFVHLDPDRRTKGRTIRPENFSPNLNEILNKLLKTGTSQRTVCVKMAPATRLETDLDVPHRAQWIGHQRECKQQLLWLGGNIVSCSNHVSIVDNEGNAFEFDTGETQHSQVVAPSLDEFLFEPHSAVLGADLVDEFAAANELGRLSYGSVYLTGPQKDCSPFTAAFRILESCAMKPKVIKEVLNSHDIGQVEWKSRGLDQKTVSRLSKIRPQGSLNGVAVLTRLGAKFVCYVCKRI
ncbi:hypothetical protein OAG68_00795 [bacterium]|nr:hypothetical protein [bacterium]